MTPNPEYVLNDVASIDFGTRVTRKKDAGSTYPVYGGGGATFSIDIFNRESCFIVSRFAMSEECVRYVDDKFFLNDSGLTVATRDPSILLQKYLDRYLLSKSPEIYDLGRGTAQRNLDTEAFKKLAISIPPIDEQKRIVAKLDEALGFVDEVAMATESTVNAIDSLWANSLFSRYSQGSAEDADVSSESAWKVARFADVIDVYQPTTIATKQLKPDGAHLVYGANGVIGRFDKFNHEQSELLMTCRGATCGALNFSKPFSWINGNAMVVRPSSEQLELRFIYYALLGGIELDSAITGTAQPQITRSSLADLRFPYPNASEQRRIVQELDSLKIELDDLKKLKTATMEALTNLRSAILSSAFAGDL